MATVRRGPDDVHVTQPAVHCHDCGFDWNSPAMADGLRLLGSCPKCGGTLEFAPEQPAPEAEHSPRKDARAPHLVLGVPRR